MADIEKVNGGLKCLMSMSDCTVCPYSYNKQREYCLCDIGKDAIELLKEQKETIDNLNETVRNLLQHIEDIGQYMTPIGLVEDVKAFVESRPQIVRCKDCKYGQNCSVENIASVQCFKWNSGEFGEIHAQDWFCADGERK